MGADPATLFLISAGISATGSFVQMKQQREAAREMTRRYEQEKRIAYIEGLQAENSRTNDMNMVLANNRAVRGASGVGDSPSFDAIQQDIIDTTKKDLASIRLNSNKVNSSYDRAIFNTKSQAYYSDIASVINAGSTIVNGWNYYNYYKSTKV
jgi:hypothetical protein|tara:strand:- start:141 stop:599 length:459 start_codon:yes stop_codon:yes gene_type:complete